MKSIKSCRLFDVNKQSRFLIGSCFVFLFFLCGQVTAEFGRRSLSLAVDEAAPVATAALRGNQLDVDKRLYLGGLPANHSTRRLNVMTSQPPPPITAHRLLHCLTASSAPLSSPPQVSSSFPGCVRSLSLNGAALDLQSPASRHDVTSCFSRDQAGSYFNGSGFAVLSEFQPGSVVDNA